MATAAQQQYRRRIHNARVVRKATEQTLVDEIEREHQRAAEVRAMLARHL